MGEKELALRCARKDKEAQRELYEEYRSLILALCRRYAENPADAEDMMQDAFIKIFKVIGNFNWTRPGSLYSWMSRVSINLAFDTAKRRRRLARQLVDVKNLEDEIPEDSSYEETASIPFEVLNEMIESLPEGYRTVFRLYCIDGLSHREIADLLGIKEKSSSASLSRARAMLAEAVRQYWRRVDDGSSSEGWEQINRKMRRADTVHHIKLILAILIPVTSIILWLQPRQNLGSDVPYISQVLTGNPSVIVPHTLQNPCGIADRTTAISSESLYIPDELPEISSEIPYISDSASDIQNEYSDTPSTTVTIIGDDFYSPTEKDSRARHKISFSLRAGSGYSRRNGTVSLESSSYIAALTFMNKLDAAYLPDAKSNSSNFIPWLAENNYNIDDGTRNTYNYLHDLPVTFGLTARMDLTARTGAECGIEYTYMHSCVDTGDEKLFQSLHFIGIPVRFDSHIWSWKGFDLYAGLGVKAEKCIAASLGQVRCEERQLQWSANSFAGVQYRIGKRTHLYFQPDLSYYFTKTDLVTYRTEDPLTFSLNAGIRFEL